MQFAVRSKPIYATPIADLDTDIIQFCFGLVKINDGKGKIAIGTNLIKQNNHITPSVHAEIDAINKIKNCKKYTKINGFISCSINKIGETI